MIMVGFIFSMPQIVVWFSGQFCTDSTCPGYEGLASCFFNSMDYLG
jgi:hypothetical protein